MSTTTKSLGGARRVVLLLATLALAVASFGAVSVSTAAPASASCAPSSMEGDWRNIDPDTRSFTRVSADFTCGGPRLCNETGECHGGESYYTLEVYGACHPTDCALGAERTTYMGDGWYRAIYQNSWRTRYVWVREYGSYLRVAVYTNYHDSRTDRWSNDWMRK